MPSSPRWLALVGAAGAAVALTACGSSASQSPTADQIASGKQKFGTCGSCHALADANMQGQEVIDNVPVPNFDDAFRALRDQGFQDSSIRGLIMGWIDLAEPPMPRHLLKGQDAYDVAAYVASVAGKGPAVAHKAYPPSVMDTPERERPQGAVLPEQTGGPASEQPPPSTSGGQTPAPAPPPAAGGQTLKLKADPSGQLKFIPSTLTAKAGKVTLQLTNASPIPHDIAIKGHGAPSQQIFGGKSASITVSLKPGTYEYYCSVPGHEQAGMKGTLTVK